MGYVEVSLEDLIDCAESGSPLQVQGPKGKEDAGRLHVEKAVVGFPQVNIDSSSKTTAGLEIWNKTDTNLKVLVLDSTVELDGVEIGRTIENIDQRRTKPISIPRNQHATERQRTGRPAVVVVLNASNIVLGKRSFGLVSCLELSMDLESGPPALCPTVLCRQIDANYQGSVKRLDACLSDNGVFTDDDAALFKYRMRDSHNLLMLLPFFKISRQDLNDTAAFMAYLNCKAEILEQGVMRCDLSGDDESTLNLACKMADKLSLMYRNFHGMAEPQRYSDLQRVIFSKIFSSVEDGLFALNENRFQGVVSNLVDLAVAARSNIGSHLPPGCQSIPSMFEELLTKTKQHLKLLGAEAEGIIAGIKGRESNESDPSDLEGLKRCFDILSEVQGTNWEGQLEQEIITSIIGRIQKSIVEYFDSLAGLGMSLLGLPNCTSGLIKVKPVYQQMSALRSLQGVDVKTAVQFATFSSQIVDASYRAGSDIERLMNDVSSFAAERCKSTGSREANCPSLSMVPAVVNDLIEAVWIDQCKADTHRQCIEKIQSVIVQKTNSMLYSARGLGSVLTEEILTTLCFVLEQFEFLSQIKSDFIPTLEAGRTELLTAFDLSVAKLEDKMKALFPWLNPVANVESAHQQTSIKTVDTSESETFLTLLLRTESYLRDRNDLHHLLQRVEAMHSSFKECIQIVITGVKDALERCLSGIREAEGVWEVQNPDVLLVCLRAGLQLKHQSKLFSLYEGSDFLTEIVNRILRFYERLSTELASSLAKVEIGQVEKLLKLVRPLCVLDEFTKDSSNNFGNLFKKYDEALAGNLLKGGKQLLDCIAASNFQKAADEISQLYPGGEIPWKIKNELSSKISNMIESIDTKLRSLSREFQTEILKEIYGEWLVLARGETAISHTSTSVRNDYNQLMNIVASDGGAARPVLGRKSLKDVLAQKMKSFQSEFEEVLIAGRYQKAANMIGKVQQLGEFELMFGIEMVTVVDGMGKTLKMSIEKRIADYENVKLEEYFYKSPSDFFRLFEPHAEDSVVEGSMNVASKFKEKLDAVWKNIEMKIMDQISKADLGRGSKDLENLEKALQSLPEGGRKTGLQEFFLKEKDTAQNKKQEFDIVVDSRNAERIMQFVSNCKPCLQSECLNSLEGIVKKITEKLCNDLDNEPCQVQINAALVKELKFVQALKCVPGCPEIFSNKLREIFQGLKNSLCKAECDARTNFLTLVSSSRKAYVDSRFPDVDRILALLNGLLILRTDLSQSPTVEADLLPQNFGRYIREVFQFIVSDHLSQLKLLDASLQAEPLDRPFDIGKIVSVLKVLTSRSALFSSASVGLMKMSDQSVSSGSVVVDQTAASPEVIVKRICTFILENFQYQPELTTKITLSSERMRAFQLIGKRVAADASLSNLIEFVQGEAEAVSVLREGFTAKVQKAGRQLWLKINELFESLASDARIDKYRDERYSANTDTELEGQRKTCEQINMMQDHVELFNQYVTPSLRPVGCVDFDLAGLKASLLEKMQTIAGQVDAVPADDLDGVAGVLVCLQIRQQELLFQRAECKRIVEQCLEKFQTTGAGKGAGISKLGFRLAGSKFRPYGEQIVQSYDAFQGYRAKAFREKTSRFKEDYVLEQMKCTGQLDSPRLLVLFREFESEYKTIIANCLRDGFGDTAGQAVVQKLLAKVKGLRLEHTAESIKWTDQIRNAIPTMVAQIFAVWTFHHSKRFLTAMGGEDKESFLFMPHPVQVIAIFCMLGLDNPRSGRGSTSDLERSLVQVRTGEGKTAVLGVAACVFGLLKVRVSCACYSEYLSNRDYASLDFLFKALGIEAFISYCTLVKLCEGEINKKVNIREKVAAVITGDAGTGNSPTRKKSDSSEVDGYPRVLLVDEVDVFFTKDFYGSTYNPACDLKHSHISDLIRQIWDEGVTTTITLDVVKGWPVYNNICSAFPSWTFLVDAAITQMVEDLAEFPSHQYEVVDGKIGYREQDGIAYNVSDRYLTIFAHIKENKSGRVSEPDMLKNLKILVQCGHFLFAKLPCKFNLVLGVTGTLETLTDTEKDIVCNQYQITRFVIMPSVYGINAVKMLGITTPSSAVEFSKCIVDEIELYSVQNGRAVIVFFQNKEMLVNFWRSDSFKSYADGGRVHVLLEEMRADEKQQTISCRSGAARAVTLATRPFGRGTDFAALDETVNSSGGIHIIATFLAETESEEIQIKGRTARQGEPGSFSLLLLQDDIKRFGVEAAHIEDIRRGAGARDEGDKLLWQMLNEKRREQCETQYKELVAFVRENEEEHTAAWAFTENLLRGNTAEVTQFLRQQNPQAVVQQQQQHGKARILVLMDATGSMGNAMRAAKETVGEMFDRATDILVNNFSGGGSDLFEMQFAVYRNYSSGPELLLEASEWRSNPQDLKDFLGRVRESGGQGNEAVEIGLWHANNQADLKQVIIIGDARANTPEDVVAKRKNHGGGETFWAKTRFAQLTGFEAEIKRLADAGVLVDTFFLGRGADPNFVWMANQTEGASFALNICTPAGARDLIDNVTARYVNGG
mmetsp:Transcript_55824/g.116793  ORF Transcript_55824/g.116793 Transcript_55824/m.116793 type:complete len:2524 (-) Transcript_55824:513-8084(-)